MVVFTWKKTGMKQLEIDGIHSSVNIVALGERLWWEEVVKTWKNLEII